MAQEPPKDPEENIIIIDERELLRAYLTEVEHRNERIVQVELAKLKFLRLVLREDARRWWSEFSENVRQQRISEYWSAYRQGQSKAAEIVSLSSGNNYCLVLKQAIDHDLIESPYTQENLQMAFQNGMRSQYPECFIEHLLDKMQKLDADVSALYSKLFTLQLELRVNRPLEREQEIIFQRLSATLQTLFEQELETHRQELTLALNFPTDELDQVLTKAERISSYIDCVNLRRRNGGQFLCQQQVVKAPYMLSFVDTYRVLFEHQSLDPFSPRLVLGNLFEAASWYLQSYRPNDQNLIYLMNDLKQSIDNLEQRRSNRLKNVRERRRYNLQESLNTFRLDHIHIWRASIPTDVSKSTIEDFFNLREQILAYQRLEQSGQLDTALLGEVISRYQAALNVAKDTQYRVELPQRVVQILLEDEDRSVIRVDLEIPAFPSGYLLGPLESDVLYWTEFLTL